MNWNEKDEWSSLADLLANLIEKYADVLDLEHLPEPPHELNANEKGEELLKHEGFPIESYKTA